MNKEMKDFLKSKNIELRVENTTTHINATSVVERMISTITRDVMIYLTKKTRELKKKHTDWLPALEESVFKINNERRLHPKIIKFEDILQEPPKITNIIPLGTTVYPFIPVPKHVNTNENKFRFRNGDMRYDADNPKVVTHYFMRFHRPLRYILDGNKDISYTRDQLLSANEL